MLGNEVVIIITSMVIMVIVINDEQVMSKEQLYDLFQQILNVKKFEHQLLYNAMQVIIIIVVVKIIIIIAIIIVVETICILHIIQVDPLTFLKDTIITHITNWPNQREYISVD